RVIQRRPRWAAPVGVFPCLQRLDRRVLQRLSPTTQGCGLDQPGRGPGRHRGAAAGAAARAGGGFDSSLSLAGATLQQRRICPLLGGGTRLRLALRAPYRHESSGARPAPWVPECGYLIASIFGQYGPLGTYVAG